MSESESGLTTIKREGSFGDDGSILEWIVMMVAQLLNSLIIRNCHLKYLESLYHKFYGM